MEKIMHKINELVEAISDKFNNIYRRQDNVERTLNRVLLLFAFTLIINILVLIMVL